MFRAERPRLDRNQIGAAPGPTAITRKQRSLRPSGFRWLILALALFDVAPVDLCEIELVAIRIFESDKRACLAFVDDVALKTNSLALQCTDSVGKRTLQLQPDCHR